MTHQPLSLRSIVNLLIALVVLFTLTLVGVFLTEYDGRMNLLNAQRSQCVSSARIRAENVNNLRVDIADLRAEVATLRSDRQVLVVRTALKQKNASITQRLIAISVYVRAIDPSARDVFRSRADRQASIASGFSCTKVYPPASLAGVF